MIDGTNVGWQCLGDVSRKCGYDSPSQPPATLSKPVLLSCWWSLVGINRIISLASNAIQGNLCVSVSKKTVHFSFVHQAQAKFSPERAKECMTWIEEVTGQKLGDIKDQIDFAEHLKDGVQLCSLINALQPGSVKKINTLKAPFKQVNGELWR